MSRPSGITMPLRVAIVGSGPAGMYAAVDLLNRHRDAQVEMFERLPAPGGLVRYGVAPDHAARRQVSEFYGRIAFASRRFRLHANVEIGRHLDHAELLAHCHAVIYASGAASDRRLGIPGEDLTGSHAATEFVGWYNGHPDFADRQFNLDTDRAVVIGNGNVALDVARMLLLSGERLCATDVADHALAALTRSRIREVVILGRRGPAQAAFTAPELLELGGMGEFGVQVDCPPEMLADDATHTHPLRLQLLREYAESRGAGRDKRLVLRFLASPVELLGSSRVEGLTVVRNRLCTSADGTTYAQATDHVATLTAGLVLRSVGYRATPLAALPFDEAAGIVPNRQGRVMDRGTGELLGGVYVAGWIKRGPSGVIGTNNLCSQQTVGALLEDAAAGRLRQPTRSPQGLELLLAADQSARIDYRAWKRIDREERRLGTAAGRPRVKLCHWQDMLSAAR